MKVNLTARSARKLTGYLEIYVRPPYFIFRITYPFPAGASPMEWAIYPNQGYNLYLWLQGWRGEGKLPGQQISFDYHKGQMWDVDCGVMLTSKKRRMIFYTKMKTSKLKKRCDDYMFLRFQGIEPLISVILSYDNVVEIANKLDKLLQTYDW